MSALTWPVGIMFWASDNPGACIRAQKDLGFDCGQLGIPGNLNIGNLASSWLKALRDEKFQITTVFAAYEGESYADVPTVQRTVGFIPPATRPDREMRTREVIEFAAAINVSSFACHIGFVPEDESDEDYASVKSMVQRVADYCGHRNMTFALETGQEPAATLLLFLEHCQRHNLKINFDPANMIMYGTGDPIAALEILKAHVVSVHCKDGTWPPDGVPGALGTEVPLGQGAVGMERFLLKLRDIGYSGILTIEREIEDLERRQQDIRNGKQLLERLQANFREGKAQHAG